MNYTDFFSEKTTGALEGTDLSLDVRYIGIKSDASLDGVSIGSVKINPMVYGANLGFRF